MHESIVLGIDIAKLSFDAALGVTTAARTFSNDDASHKTMITAVAGHTVELIVTEANSGLEPDLA
ncbi:hypothetical protein C662_03220 [Thauera sp. 28]|uniref:hypothetical protein n=1 Tax=Thauera sp. 28 TaxID=303682 RepID=UPI0002D0D1DE|nr:hypothetical protein [Thauera sp. 28]ENO94524.1 hypothetical protein C662_03220 [Thauera sp. 28]